MNKKVKRILAAVTATAAIVTSMSAMAPAFAADGLTYTGSALTPGITLYDGDVLLVEGIDYDLSYENNINVGTATIIATFKGNYDGSTRATFKILPRAISEDEIDVSGVEASYVFEDAAIEPEPVIKLGEVTLVKGQDYELEYVDNTHPGEATIKVTFTGNYDGETSINFEITPKDLSTDENLVISEIPTQTFTGEPIEPKPEIKYGEKTLVEGKDYDLEYTDNINVGEGTVKVVFKNDYSGEKEYKFVIEAKAVTDENTELTGIQDVEFTGKDIIPALVIKVDGCELLEGKDYTVTYENNKNVGTATGKIEYIGNYSGEKDITFNITPFIVNDDNVRLSVIPDQIYTGSEIMPAITVSIIRK